MEESTREGLNFLLVITGALAAVAFLSVLMLPSWVHGHPLFVAAAVVVATYGAHRLVYSGTLAELGYEPLPPRPEEDDRDWTVEADEVEGKTPKERVEKRREDG